MDIGERELGEGGVGRCLIDRWLKQRRGKYGRQVGHFGRLGQVGASGLFPCCITQ